MTATGLASGASGGYSTSSDLPGTLASLTAEPLPPTRRLFGPRAIGNWEFMGHGFTQQNMQKVGRRGRETSSRTAEAIARFTGRRPRGWLGPGLTETWETPDLLVEAGYELRLRIGCWTTSRCV